MDERLLSHRWEDYRGSDFALRHRLYRISSHRCYADRGRATMAYVTSLQMAALARHSAWASEGDRLRRHSEAVIHNYLVAYAQD